jgi:hypothetical protein
MATNNNGDTLAAYGYVPATFTEKKLDIEPIYNYIYNMYQIGNIPNINTLTERYILTTYSEDNKKKLGEVEWISNYISSTSHDGTKGGLTDIDVDEFMVTANQGLYKNIYKIIFNFTNKVRNIK